jgi:hypothetical protein
VWGYIDNIRQVARKDIDVYDLSNQFDKEPNEKEPPECYFEGKKLEDIICLTNKAFTMALNGLPEEGYSRHAENLLDIKRIDMPAQIILMYIEECKEFDAIIFVTNDAVYLMNDKGQTIERLN